MADAIVPFVTCFFFLFVRLETSVAQCNVFTVIFHFSQRVTDETIAKCKWQSKWRVTSKENAFFFFNVENSIEHLTRIIMSTLCIFPSAFHSLRSCYKRKIFFIAAQKNIQSPHMSREHVWITIEVSFDLNHHIETINVTDNNSWVTIRVRERIQVGNCFSWICNVKHWNCKRFKEKGSHKWELIKWNPHIRGILCENIACISS